ncbi:hypothetical protein [Niabella drilacis]|uniref:hypothetical protein n=1 Tax=Niabella drilacis (strain DSM 25811 / CCM 8410 / CCUG 62505 / LMG 26954 / E90) TaxID=1285928 RepID=UPI000B865E88|nr:hypothetical protein [Niabella drilacis]
MWYGTSPSFPEIFKGIPRYKISYRQRWEWRLGPDLVLQKEDPDPFFYTGGHPDYHKTGDDASKIDFKALRSILELEIRVIDRSMNVPKMNFTWTN